MIPAQYADLMRDCADVEAIDFYFARQLALVPAFNEEDRQRWFYCLLALSAAQRQGHSCLALDAIANKTWFANTDTQQTGIVFESLPTLIRIVTQAIADSKLQKAVHYEHGRFYSRRYWQFEQDIAAAVVARSAINSLDAAQYEKLTKAWPAWFSITPQSQQDWQQVAVAASLSRHFGVINGGPGTGKTYTVARLLLALQTAFDGALNIQLAAPTGKAAQRLNESIAANLQRIDVSEKLRNSMPEDAKTLHRLLGIQRFGVQTRYHQDQPLDCDVLIIDEASMVDVALMARVVRALPAHARLYLIGDAQQLPAVEAGNVLEALVGNKRDEDGVRPALANHVAALCPHLPALPEQAQVQDYVVTLQVSQRFSGTLAQVATAVLSGDAKAAWQSMQPYNISQPGLLEEGVSVASLNASWPLMERLIQHHFHALKHSKNAKEAMQALAECRWLTPVREGPYGVGQLNQRIAATLGFGREQSVNAHYKGRPVMVAENHYAQNLFNGDIGVIWPDEQGQLKAWFETAEGDLRAISLSRLPRVETVYAMTIHKSQGSEFQQVLLLLPPATSTQAMQLCNRALLYTGLTRAKQHCLIVSEQQRFAQIMAQQQQRFSGVADSIARQSASDK